MRNAKDNLKVKREKMRQEELKSPSSSIQGSKLAELVGGLNWKFTGMVILVIIIFGVYFLLKFNPPLEIDTIASNEDNKSVVVGIDNNGFRDVKILDVSVNNNEKPIETKLQVSNSLQGFVLTDDFQSEEAKAYGFTNIEDVVIKAGTSKDDETVSKDDEIYGVSVIYNEEINNVYIEYSHFGMTFNDTVYFNNY
ncbi:DUF6366 family protein (plasmid) [Niallia taxi]|uniref:DUF6366 family protein n=1 Tax=Niallia taxi TaxID=2499688 RepID=UPI00293472E6|nr:DUF6366 family protein [Niallia taxi]WOD65853.1 DUF6366 family protein [Niallia taxi]